MQDGWVQDSRRFEIGERLGIGGTGTVYSAWDRERGQKVALKVLRTKDPQALYHFKKEFRALADVSHPHLVTIFELFAESERWYFTLELVDGEHFSDYVRPDDGETESDGEAAEARIADSERVGGRLDAERLRSSLAQLAVGIKALHDTGLLHCDLKPSNVLVTSGGLVKILDFGLATELRPEDQSKGGGFAGTIAFTAPEQAAGEAVSAATDWYSFGVILFQALAGRLPFEGPVYKVILAKTQSDAPPVRDVAAEAGQELPPELDDLADLCDELLARDAGRRPPGREILQRLGVEAEEPSRPARRDTDRRLIGRGEQLDALDDAYLVSLQRQAVSVYLYGRSGMGKTALADYFLDRVTARGATVLRGRCYEREMVPYKGLDGIVDSLSRHLASVDRDELPELLPDEFPALLRLFPVLERAVPRRRAMDGKETADLVADLVTLRRRGFGALRDVLSAIAHRGPLVLFVDDLQWADADSIALLEELVRPPDPPPLVMLGTFRSEEIGRQPFLRELLSRAGSATQRQIEIDRLDDEQSRELVSFLLPDGEELPDIVMDSLVREGHGTPFLLEQMAGFVAIKRKRLITGIHLSEMFEERLRPLPEGSRELMLTLTVANRPLALPVAWHAAQIEGDPQRLVAALRSASFVRSSGTAQRIELYHSRIGETLDGLIDSFQRQEIRRRLATAYEACGLDDPQALFEHLLGAGEHAKAAEQAARAAQAAFDALAFDRAARFFRQALELDAGPVAGLDSSANASLEAERRRRLRRGLADSLAYAGRSGEAGRLYLDLSEAAREESLALQCRAAEQYLMGGHVEAGLDVARKVLDSVGLRMPGGGRKRALASLLFNRLRLRLRGLDFKHRSESEIDTQDLVRIDTCWAMATGLSMADNIRGADFQTRNLLLSLKAGEPYRVARALSMEAAFLSSTGDLDRAEDLLERAQSLAEQVESDHALGLVRMQYGLLDYFSGRSWSRAAAAFDEAETIFRDRCRGVPWELTVCRRFGLASLMYQGEIAELRRRVPVYLAEARERGDSHLASTVRSRVNIVWLAADDPAEARRRVGETLRETLIDEPQEGDAGETLARSERQGGFSVDRYNALLAQVQTDLYEGDAVGAWERLDAAEEALRRSMLTRIQLILLETSYLRGRVALACAAATDRGILPGRKGASEHLKTALREADRIEGEKTAWAGPLAGLLRAGVAARRGETAEAAGLLGPVVAGCEATSTGLFAAAARRRWGEVLGGEKGQELIGESDRWMRRQRIVDPERMTAMLAPGY